MSTFSNYDFLLNVTFLWKHYIFSSHAVAIQKWKSWLYFKIDCSEY